MMDATPLFPSGFHPVRQTALPDLSSSAPRLSRLDTRPVNYYFIDFSIAVRVPFGMDPKRTLGIIGLDQDVPELSDTVPYDPFKVDIFILGNLFQKQFIAVSRTSLIFQHLRAPLTVL